LTDRRLTTIEPVTLIWQASRALGSFAFIPLASVARSFASIAEHRSAPSSTTTQHVPQSQSPLQTVGQNHPCRCAALINDSPAATSTTASAGSTRTAGIGA
jgi:hypothetical protein